jgi:hypothetical protein
MSAGVDAMGVAVRLTPALVVAMAVVLAPSAQAQTAEPAQAPADRAQVPQVEPIDPDCDPEQAERADPDLVEEPDGICPPDEAERPGERPGDRPAGGAKPEPEPGPPSGSPLEGAPPSGQPEPGAPREPGTPAAGPGSGPTSGADRGLPKRGPRPAPSPERHGRDRRDGAHRGPATKPERNAAGKQERTKSGKQERTKSGKPERTGSDKPKRAGSGKGERRAGSERDRLASGSPRTAPRPGPLAITRYPKGSLEPLPDPLPPARRLDPAFAKRLERVADRSGIAWELMLAVLRARGHRGAAPADRAGLRRLARRLAGFGGRKDPRRALHRWARATPFAARPAVSAATRRDRFVRRAVALAHYNRAVGLGGLVRGLERVKRRLARRVLDHHRLVIYEGGREDIRSGFTDVRVLVLLLYLSSRSSEVTVTSLTSGHSFLTASGNVSLHSHGRAVDIAAIGGRPILGNQRPGGLTERTLRKIMLLPKGLQPTELISLFELGGPSFALADHADHIHVGY